MAVSAEEGVIARQSGIKENTGRTLAAGSGERGLCGFESGSPMEDCVPGSGVFPPCSSA